MARIIRAGTGAYYFDPNHFTMMYWFEYESGAVRYVKPEWQNLSKNQSDFLDKAHQSGDGGYFTQWYI